MALPRNQKIIVTSADGGKRRRLPAAQIVSGTARVERYGGYGQFTVSTAIAYHSDALASIVKGDRVELYYQGTLRYRGFIEERLEAEGDPSTLAFTGFGLSFLVGQQLCYGRYAYAGAGKDLGDVFAEIVRDATFSRNQTLPPAAGRLGLPLYDALQVAKIGTTSTFVDAYHKLLKDVANDLVQNQASNLAIWGGDVDAFGQNRLYFRPLAPTTFPPMHTVLIPSRQTESAQSEDQAGDVKNRVLLTGGNARFPQLVHNGGFDLPVVFQQGDSGLIDDGDFEGRRWGLSNGASYKDAGHNEGQPFSGNWMVEMDHPGEAADHSGTFASSPVAGDSYVFSVRAKKEVGLQTADGSGYLHIQDAGGNLLLSVPLVVAPFGTAWDYFSATFAMPGSAAKYAVHFQADHVASYGGDSGGLLVDVAALEDASVIYQDGYQTAVYGNAQFIATNWVYKDTAYDGLYCVYVRVRAQDVDLQDAHLEPLNRARFNISVKQALRGSLRYRSPVQQTPGLSLPKMRLHLDWFRQDGSYIGNTGVDVTAQPVSSTWQYLELVAAPPGDAASCCPTVIFRTSGEALIDAISVQDAEALVAGDVPMDADGHPAYLPEGSLSTFVTGSGSGLGGAWAASEAQYGSRVDIAAEGSVDTLSGLTQVATGRLRNTALPLTRPSVTRIADARVYWPGDSISLQGRRGQAMSGGQILSIAAVEISLGDLFRVKLEIDKEQPSTDLIVKRLILDQLTANGPGGSAGTSTGGYTNPTNGGGSSQGSAYRTTLAGSATDPTLHDVYTGVPHASQASQDAWSATSAEVALARASALHNTTYPSLPAHLAAMEQAIGSGNGPGNGATSVYAASPPYYRMQAELNVLSRIPVASDFSGPSSTFYASGADGSLRFETPGLALNAYWTMSLENTGGAAAVVNWSVPAVDNFAGVNWQGSQIFSSVGGSAPVSGTFTIAAGTTGLLELFYANTNGGVYNTSNQGTFWWMMDALLTPGVVFLDAATGQSPQSIIIGDATTAVPGLVEVHANAFSGQHPVVYLDTEVDALLGTETTARTNADTAEATARQNADQAEASARSAADALALQKAANLSDLGSASAARTNLGLGTAAVASLPAAGSNASADQVVRGDDTRLGTGSTSSGGGILSVSALPVASASTAVSLYRLLAGSSSGVLTAQGTEFDSGSSFSGFTGPNVFDGDPNTAYAGGGSNYVGLDFGAGKGKQITQIRYMGRASYESRMVGGVFQGSNTSATTGFVTLATVTTAPGANPAYTTVSVADTTPYRWVRYTNGGQNGTSSNYVDVAEIEFTGTSFFPDRLYVSAEHTNGTYGWVQLASG